MGCTRCDRDEVYARDMCSTCYGRAYRDGEFGNYRSQPRTCMSPGAPPERVAELREMHVRGTLFTEVERILDRELGTAAAARSFLEQYERRTA